MRFLFVLLLFLSAPVEAARFDPQTKLFRLDGGAVTYSFGINGNGSLRSVYWGARLAADDPFSPALKTSELAPNHVEWASIPQEYPGFGAGLLSEPALKITFPDGARDLVLRYASHRLIENGVAVLLKDISRPVHVELRYMIDPETGIVARSTAITNRGDAPFKIDQAMAAAFALPPGSDYQLHYLTGGWASETSLHTRAIDKATTVLESRTGSTGFKNNPWFAVGRDGATAEETGPVWFGALAWSGSWRITIEQDQNHHVRIAGGYNPFDFGYSLKPGATLTTPTFYAGYSGEGIGGASRAMHRFQRTHILARAGNLRLRPVLYNSWYATEFAIDEAGQMRLADKAARIGVERFMMDDGWFGARNNDRAGLGDWTVNTRKFPRGLKPLIDHVRGLGMEFALWVEPEMVNPDSDLYRAHPDWVINMRDRPRSEARQQMVLNLARPEVRDHILGVLDRLLKENDIDMLKWDYNRAWSEPGWPEVAAEDQQRLYVDYVENLYSILRELRRRHPKLEIEGSSGGGGRIDLGIMALTDQVWTSDNTDPFDRLTIQHGFTHAYTPAAMMAWVTDSPDSINRRVSSLDFRLLSAMQGGLGIGANLDHWSEADFVTATRFVADYKRIRRTVQQGDLYRLLPPGTNSSRVATMSVAQDRRQAVVFAFLHSSTLRGPQPAIVLQGLDRALTYRARILGGGDRPASVPAQASGAYWMAVGLNLPMRGDFQATGVVLDALKRDAAYSSGKTGTSDGDD